MKATWKILNNIITKKNSVNLFPDKFYENGMEITNKIDIAKGFNKFFVNVGPTLAKNISDPSNGDIFRNMSVCNHQSMFLDGVTKLEILKVVNNCKNKYSCDCNDLSMHIVKSTFNAIVQPFTYICNLSFQSGVFPNKIKIAKVIPLFKTGEKSNFTNYRPVSLLPQFSKMLEKLFDVILKFFLTNINCFQSPSTGLEIICQPHLH